MTHPVLDWRPKWDARSDAFRFSAVPMCASLTARTKIQRTKEVWLDQGSEGACTGFGAEHVQALSPYPRITDNNLAREVYYEARRQDEWAGEDYEGSSVNGAMRAERVLGRVKSWRWATTTVEARHGLSYHGAGELGIWWYSGMWDTDENGFVHKTGSQVGGHALALSGFFMQDGEYVYVLENSWGPGWGVNGQALLWETDLADLLAMEGELAFPLKIR